MTNYKPLHLVNSVSIGGVTETFSINTKIIQLFFFHDNGTIAKSLMTYHNNTVYTVPTGKKFRAIGFRIFANQNGYSVISTGDTLNAETSLLTYPIVNLPASGVGAGLTETYNGTTTWTAGKYITSNPFNNGIYALFLTGVEEDA